MGARARLQVQQRPPLGKRDDKLGDLVLEPLDLSAGLWRAVAGNTTVEVECGYVDDGLIAGSQEVIKRVTAFFRSMWKIKSA